jgi:hypothetical protein
MTAIPNVTYNKILHTYTVDKKTGTVTIRNKKDKSLFAIAKSKEQNRPLA